MRRSIAVKLTLLPVLASAAVAAADPPGADPAPDAPLDPRLSPPGMTEPSDPGAPPPQIELAPPGLTPAIMDLDCYDDPNWRLRPDCDLYDGGHPGGVIRGGFGGYFWSGGG